MNEEKPAAVKQDEALANLPTLLRPSRRQGRLLVRNESDQPARVSFRINSGERLFLMAQADLAQVSLSEYIRKVVMGRLVVARSDQLLLARLNSHGGLIKKFLIETGGKNSPYLAEAEAALRELAETARVLREQIQD